MVGTGRGRWSWAPLVVVLGAVAVPPLWAGGHAVRHRLAPFMPDLPETLLAAMGAAHFDQLVGAWSRLGIYHPGPAWFYWAAPFVSATGDHPSGLLLAALALVAACGVALVAVLARHEGVTAGTGAGVVVLVAVRQLSVDGLSFPWNPTVLILPVALALVCAAVGCARGSWPVAVAGGVLGSAVAQAHLGAVALGLVVAVISVGGGAWARRRLGRPLPVGAWVVGAVVLALPWVPVAVDQVAGSGNAGAVVRYLVRGEVTDPHFTPAPVLDQGGRSTSSALGTLAALVTLAEPRTAVWGGASLPEGAAHRARPATVAVAAALLALALAGAGLVPPRAGPGPSGAGPRSAGPARPSPGGEGPRGARRGLLHRWRPAPDPAAGAPPPGRRDRWPSGPGAVRVWLLRLGLLGLAVELVATVRVQDQFRPYLVAGASGVGIALWVGVALLARERLRAWVAVRGGVAPRVRWAAHAVPVVAAVLLAATLARPVGYLLSYGVDVDAPEVHTVLAAVDGPVVVEIERPGELGLALRIVAGLEHRGRAVAVRGEQVAHVSDRQRRAPAVGTRIWFASAPRPPGCASLAFVQGLHICVAPRP